MSNLLMYKGYFGTQEISVEDDCLHGKLEFITSLVTYESSSPSGLKAEFEAAVDDYLATCEKIGSAPEKPFKGVFNVRVDPELHREIAVKAIAVGCSLNEMVGKALAVFVREFEGAPVAVRKAKKTAPKALPKKAPTKGRRVGAKA